MLLIDVGNTCIKSAVWLDGDWIIRDTVAYNKNNFRDQFNQIIRHLSPQPVFISCVVDAMKEPLSSWFYDQWAVRVKYVVAEKKMCGVINSYVHAETLGVDRWLAMIAAYVKFKKSVCVIDCGTAVTVDVIDAVGVHKGGLILPGLQLMRDSLYGNTSKLKPGLGHLVELADNTQDAVESGCYQLLALGLDRICEKQRAIYSDMQIVITGGDGEYIGGIMQVNPVFIPTLVLDGLLIAAMQEC